MRPKADIGLECLKEAANDPKRTVAAELGLRLRIIENELERLMPTKMIVFVILACTLIASCGVSPGMANAFGRGAEITASKSALYAGSCDINIKFQNLATTAVKPYVSYVAFDSNGNTLGSNFSYFDPILASKYQEKKAFVSADCYKIAALSFTDAYDQASRIKFHSPSSGSNWEGTMVKW